MLVWKMQLLELPLSQTSNATSKLQHASTNLDVGKVGAEDAFRKAVRNLPRGRFGHRVVRRIKNRIKRHPAIGSHYPSAMT
jgi:hypothetical protein